MKRNNLASPHFKSLINLNSNSQRESHVRMHDIHRILHLLGIACQLNWQTISMDSLTLFQLVCSHCCIRQNGKCLPDKFFCECT